MEGTTCQQSRKELQTNLSCHFTCHLVFFICIWPLAFVKLTSNYRKGLKYFSLRILMNSFEIAQEDPWKGVKKILHWDIYDLTYFHWVTWPQLLSILWNYSRLSSEPRYDPDDLVISFLRDYFLVISLLRLSDVTKSLLGLSEVVITTYRLLFLRDYFLVISFFWDYFLVISFFRDYFLVISLLRLSDVTKWLLRHTDFCFFEIILWWSRFFEIIFWWSRFFEIIFWWSRFFEIIFWWSRYYDLVTSLSRYYDIPTFYRAPLGTWMKRFSGDLVFSRLFSGDLVITT